ncbi:phage capsid protein [Levilactobacillus yiduensis]|uniref:phage capsid protein n=1 Tax=Levilactobacillus yiduensis TaxID=2953880 RepID=UPI0021578FFB|nr:phage capsid protein [Levilactobacillus yiduensis]
MAITETTKLSDLIEPTVFLDYVQEQVSNTNAFIQSGILGNDPILGARLLSPGRTVQLPYINDLTGEAEEWSDSTDITTESLTTGSNEAMKLFEDKAYSATDFGQLVTGAPVLTQITSRFAAWWVRQDTKRLLQVAESTFANTDIATAKSFGVGNEAELSAGNFLAALARMGDLANPKLVKLAMNSSAYFELRKQNLIDDFQPSDGGLAFASYNGLQIVQDDDIPVAADGTTAAYAFAPGAMAYATATPANGLVVDRDEYKNGGQEAIIQKRVTAMQVNGTTIDTSVVSDIAAYRQAIIDGKAAFKVANDPRKLGIVKYGFKVDPSFIVPTINSPKDATTPKA